MILLFFQATGLVTDVYILTALADSGFLNVHSA